LPDLLRARAFAAIAEHDAPFAKHGRAQDLDRYTRFGDLGPAKPLLGWLRRGHCGGEIEDGGKAHGRMVATPFTINAREP
jgi:hypothetical protein